MPKNIMFLGFFYVELLHFGANINIQELLVPNPATSFIIRVKGESMTEANIPDGALLVVDKSLRQKAVILLWHWCMGSLLSKGWWRRCVIGAASGKSNVQAGDHYRRNAVPGLGCGNENHY